MYMMLVFDNPMAQGVLALHTISRLCVAREGLWKLVNRNTWGSAKATPPRYEQCRPVGAFLCGRGILPRLFE